MIFLYYKINVMFCSQKVNEKCKGKKNKEENEKERKKINKVNILFLCIFKNSFTYLTLLSKY